MKRTLILLAALLLAPVAGLAAAAPSKPNIVFLLFDDMGYGQPQCYNPQSALRTPNLDRLATQGMRFTDAHSGSAVCTPTRYGVLTGRYPSRIGQFGVLGNTSQPIIPTTRMTVASLLKQHGYATACIGKWHLGLNWTEKPGKSGADGKFRDGPNALGFDFFYGYTEARSLGMILEQDKVAAHVPAVNVEPMMIAKAVDWIGEQAKSDKPFFLYFPACPPHAPIVPAPEYAGKGGKDVVKNENDYADWVYQGDAMLGQIMEALEKNHLAENTILIVTADNGAAGRAYVPLKAAKASIYEGGHRVPYVVRWPGKVKAGSTWNHTICLNDLMATAAEITGATIPANAAEDSVSILAALLGKSAAPTREATVHQSHAGDFAIRQGPWKAVFFKDGHRELYNLTDDLGEKHDVRAANPEVLTTLTALFQRYIDNGRSTPGAIQKNEFALSLEGNAAGKKSNRKAKQSRLDDE